ncbi:type II and III secretion system protein [bacterium]|nr:type II and III secretion system protein [bacterium]
MVKQFCSLFILVFALETWAQGVPAGMPAAPGAAPAVGTPTGPEKPSGKRIRRQLNLIVGLDHDEEILIPDKKLKIGGRDDFFTINRIKGTDIFRINPKKAGNGITTLIDEETGQILVELRFDIRDDSIEKTLREVQAMLSDIDGIEFKIINNTIYIDGYVLIPRDLVRIAQVIKTWPPDRVQSLATLSPLARKKIADFISNDVNNPEVKITSVGDYIKLEGQVNSAEEKRRINQIVSLYLPDLVIEVAPDTAHLRIMGRKNSGKIEDLIIDLITIKKDDEKVEPPPKMIQIVAHFVKFGDNYGKSFSFKFSPALSAQAGGQASNGSNSTIDSTINLLSNLLPKLNWAKVHGYAKVLDTASILVQDKVTGRINRNVVTSSTKAGQNGAIDIVQSNANVSLSVTPTIKAERSGLVELKNLTVSVTTTGGKTESSNSTDVQTTISVRDRQSAAFGGIIKKATDTSYGAPTDDGALITFNASKNYDRVNSQFVVFVTPIIKSSASSGVEQVKKKFRLRD